MKTTSVVSLAVTIALAFWAPAAMGQAVDVSTEHGVVTLSVTAQKAYALTASSHAKAPVTSTFDLTGLRAEVDKHPECAMK